MNYPNGLDTFIDPIASNKLNSPSHSAIERAQNAALEALEAYTGTIGSTSVTSITFQLNHLDPSHITGVIPVSAGGTGATSTTGSFNAISPLTTLGDLLTFGPTSNPNNVRFPLGTDGFFLRANRSVTAFGLEWLESPAVYSVNADENINTWQTQEIPMPFGSSPSNGWTYSFSILNVYNNGISVDGNAGVTMVSTVGIHDEFFGSTDVLLFSASREYKTACTVQIESNFGSGIWGFIGFATGVNQNDGDQTDVTTPRIGFAFNNLTMYALCCNGSSVTATSLGAYTGVVKKLFIDVSNGTSAKFYINGTLAATITTNMPSTGTVKLSVSGKNGGGAGCGFAFVSNFILAQKLS